jgi:hypothetical protein
VEKVSDVALTINPETAKALGLDLLRQKRLLLCPLLLGEGYTKRTAG